MKIVVLDGYTTNPGDLRWEELEKLGELEIYDWTDEQDIIPRLQNVTAVITNKVVLNKKHFSLLPQLKYIGVLATGYDNVDIEEAKKHGITVTNIPQYASHAVSQLAFALILECCYHIEKHSKSITEDLYWSKNPYNSYWLNPLIGLENKTLGVLGMGRIGQQTAAIGKAFGMKILAHDVYRPEIPEVEWAELEDVLSRSDFVSLHCPLLESTRGIINKQTLSIMKPTAFLINTSRGALVKEADLAFALNNGLIAGAGLDVLSTEPPALDNPLLKAKNVVLTPHIGWATIDARKKLIQIAAENLESYFAGSSKNVIAEI